VPGTRDDNEAAAARAEEMSQEAAAELLRPGDREDAVTLPSAVRWVRRRQQLVRAVLTAVIGLLPALFARCEATVASFVARLGRRSVLVALRQICAAHLHALPRPLGLNPSADERRRRLFASQQARGPDPPRLLQ
jgi:hypothetical protein